MGHGPVVNAEGMIIKPSGDLYMAGSNGLAGNGVSYGTPCFARYNSSGSLDWVNYFSGGNNSLTHTEFIAEDNNGNMVAAYYGSELDFDGTPTPVSPKTVLVKFDTTGEVLWVNYFGGNQYDILNMSITGSGDVVIIVSGQFISTEDTTVTSSNKDMIIVLDEADGSFKLVDHAGYWPTSGFVRFDHMVPFGTSSIMAITSETSVFAPIKTYITELDIVTNEILSQDTVLNIFHTSTVAVQSGTVLKIHDFDPDTKLAYVSGRAVMAGLSVGTDSIFGVNPNSASMFIAKIDFSTGNILNKVVYYTPGVQEGVQLGVKGADQISFFVQYRDTVRNENTGDVFTEMDTIPTSGHPHCLIQNFDLDLNLNYWNQTTITGSGSFCNAAGYDQNGALYQLYRGNALFHYDNTPFNADELDVIAKIGGTPNGIEETALKSVSIYPNPSNGQFNVESFEPLTRLGLYNLAGQIVAEYNTKRTVNQQINLPNLRSGVYLLQIETEQQQSVERVVVY